MPAAHRKPTPPQQHGVNCECCVPTAAAQSLDEVAFDRSAAAAASRGDYFAVQSIITRRPAELHSDGHGGSSGYTPLHYAARAGHADICELLLSRGADPNAATRAGSATPLHRAAGQGHAAVVRLLLARGADPGLADADGQTALHKAAAGRHREVAALLEAQAPALAAARDCRGRTAADLLCAPS